jgi:hydrogenase expression/formation protein HypD
MKPFSDVNLFKMCIDKICLNAQKLGTVRIMEVCGTHTMEIGRSGLRSLLPGNIKLISGPGCPVCVTPATIIDTACDLALSGNTILTFGDMVRVPGNKRTLEAAKSSGGMVEPVVSPLLALKIATDNPNRQFIFIAVGFETTTPAIARTVECAFEQNINNLLFLVAHRTVPPALSVLMQDTSLSINGFLLPGHVCTVTGTQPFTDIIGDRYPAVVTGFEPLDIVTGIMTITDMLVSKHFETVNKYRRIVRDDGNLLARQQVERVFKPVDAVWRGIGMIPGSGLALREKFSHLDACSRFGLSESVETMPAGCGCGDVLKGKITPPECKLFGSRCVPDHPVGPCMVSTEGSCAAWYKFGG